MLEDLEKEVCKTNMRLPKLSLVSLTWGNVSRTGRERGLSVTKSSGVPYEEMKPEDMVAINLDGEIVEGDLNSSNDTPVRTYLYNHFPKIGGAIHIHSPWVAVLTAVRMDIPTINTTHADTFYTDVPVADVLTKEGIEEDYKGNTGKAIARSFKKRSLDYEVAPAALVMQYGPFIWGPTPGKAVYNAKVLEVTAEEGYHTMQLAHQDSHLPQYLLDEHYYRKHGASAYHEQNNMHSRDHAVHA